MENARPCLGPALHVGEGVGEGLAPNVLAVPNNRPDSNEEAPAKPAHEGTSFTGFTLDT